MPRAPRPSRQPAVRIGSVGDLEGNALVLEGRRRIDALARLRLVELLHVGRRVHPARTVRHHRQRRQHDARWLGERREHRPEVWIRREAPHTIEELPVCLFIAQVGERIRRQVCKSSVFRAAEMAAPCSPPVASWLGRNRYLSGSGANRFQLVPRHVERRRGHLPAPRSRSISGFKGQRPAYPVFVEAPDLGRNPGAKRAIRRIGARVLANAQPKRVTCFVRGCSGLCSTEASPPSAIRVHDPVPSIGRCRLWRITPLTVSHTVGLCLRRRFTAPIERCWLTQSIVPLQMGLVA